MSSAISKNFDDLFRTLYPELVAFANKITVDLAASEDLVQDVFVYLYENNHKNIIKKEARSYLFRATYNRCISLKRKQITAEKYLNQIREEDLQEFHDLLIQTDLEKKIYQEVQKLPPRCKQIFMLSKFEDVSNDDIAQKLNISKRTVETQISNALKALRSSLDPKTFFTFFL